MQFFFAIVKRDFSLNIKYGSANMMTIMFFVLTVSLFPFGIGPDLKHLSQIGPGIIWVCALFSVMLSLERVFQNDYEDGSIELLAIQPVALEIVVVAKVLVHWFMTGMALIISAPFLLILMNVPNNGFWTLIISLLLGTPSLSLIGSMGAALIMGSRKSGVLLSLIILPLYVPILIFGILAVDSAIKNLPNEPHFSVLTAIFLGSLAFCPWVTASAIRQALDN